MSSQIQTDKWIGVAQEFHRNGHDSTQWTSARARALLGDDWEDVEIWDQSDYNYDFCDSFDLVRNGSPLVSVDISHVAPVFRFGGWAVGRARRRRMESELQALAHSVVAKLRQRLTAAGLLELSDVQCSRLVRGVRLELSEPDEVTLGKCLFKDYDGPPLKGGCSVGQH